MKVDITQHAEFSKYVDIGLKKAVRTALHSTAVRIVQTIVVDIIPNEEHPPVDRGLYRAGWRVETLPTSVDIVNTVPHSPFIDEGVRPDNVKPGRGMINALKGWIQRKGIGGSPDKPSWKQKKGVDELTSTAWAIAQSMKGYMSKAGWVPGTGIFKGSNTPGGLRITERAMQKFDLYFGEEIKSELKKVGDR